MVLFHYFLGRKGNVFAVLIGVLEEVYIRVNDFIVDLI